MQRKNFRKILSLLVASLMLLSIFPAVVFAADEVEINEINFPDSAFRDYVTENFDKDENGKLSDTEIAGVTSIDVDEMNITTLKGVEYFTALTSLSCCDNQLTSLDVGNNTALVALDCGQNQLTSLELSNNAALAEMYCNINQLKTLDLSKNTALAELSCQQNMLTSLDLSDSTALTILDCGQNQLTSLDLGNNTELIKLFCNDNQLTSLDVGNNTALTTLYCYNNQLTSLDVGNNTALTDIRCNSNQLTSLDLSNNTALTYLSCSNNQLTSLELSNNTALTKLYCSNNQLTSLDLSKNTLLTFFDCAVSKKLPVICTRTADTADIDISTLPGSFDMSKASNWRANNGDSITSTLTGTVLSFPANSSDISYDYDVGMKNAKTVQFGFSLFSENKPCATVESIDFGTAAPGYTPEIIPVSVNNTGTVSISSPRVNLTGEGKNNFILGVNGVPGNYDPGVHNSNWWVSPKKELPEGTYTCTLELTATELSQPVTATVTFTVYDPLSVKYGDIDGNGIIQAADARLCLRASVGLEVFAANSVQARACDVDGNGTIQAADARLILRKSVGLETSFPAEKK